MKRRAVRLVVWVVLLLASSAGLIRGYTLMKAYGAEKKWWDAPPSLNAWDPKERIDAAAAAARKYGGKQ